VDGRWTGGGREVDGSWVGGWCRSRFALLEKCPLYFKNTNPIQDSAGVLWWQPEDPLKLHRQFPSRANPIPVLFFLFLFFVFVVFLSFLFLNAHLGKERSEGDG
jgi:hypothetical protein